MSCCVVLNLWSGGLWDCSALGKAEFTKLLQKLNPGITEDGVNKTLKKAKVKGDTMDIHGFFRWMDKMFGKADQETFDGLMTMFMA